MFCRLSEAIFRLEPKYPIHVVPQCWQVYNEKHNIKRGLFFLDGQEWQEMRKKMNPVFLKNVGINIALKSTQRVTKRFLQGFSDLMDPYDNLLDLKLDPILHKWSVDSTLSALYGDCYETRSDLDIFVNLVHDMFDASAVLQTQSADYACQESSQDWQKFECAANGTLHYLHHNFAHLKVHLRKK